MKRALLAALLLLHVTVLALGSLPWSPFVAQLFPYYAGYLRWTGQLQGWAMYQYPDHRSQEFELIARFPDGREERPWGDVHEMSSRNFYFLESLFLRNDEQRFAYRFLDVLRERWPTEPRPSALVLRRTSRPITEYARVSEQGALGAPVQQELVRRW